MSKVLTTSSNINKLPFEKSFAGHDTFAFRYMWLKKGIDHVLRDPEIFLRDDAIVHLGVGKNMIRAIRHWCRATRVTDEEISSNKRSVHCTELGMKLLGDNGWDPYLEDDASLWLLHWNLVSAGTRAATWYLAFNQFREYAFTRSTLTDALARILEHLGWTDVAISTLERDVDCLVHTYLPRPDTTASGDDEISCPLSTLGLLVQENEGDRLRFQRGPKPSLPPEVFAYSLVEFWNYKQASIATMEVRDIIGSEGSPATVFKLDEDSVLSYLDILDDLTHGAMIFEDTPLVRRVVRKNEEASSPLELLEHYYSGK